MSAASGSIRRNNPPFRAPPRGLSRLDNPNFSWKTGLVKQTLVALDLEGVLVPEIWISVAEKTRIPELRRTTRDEPDYDKLMRGRIKLLDEHGLKLADIQEVIADIEAAGGGA